MWLPKEEFYIYIDYWQATMIIMSQNALGELHLTLKKKKL